ncbi:hypothetical protein JCM5296_006726 [Sporobolomyces johnsonii]
MSSEPTSVPDITAEKVPVTPGADSVELPTVVNQLTTTTSEGLLEGKELGGEEEARAEGYKTPEEMERESKYLTGKKLVLVFFSMLLSVFLIALDQTILAPALPVIASKFNALDEIAWIASAYFLTQTAFLLLYGQALTLFDRKWTFLVAISVFELGSLICAVSPTVDSLITGRAVAGCGAAGIFVACLSIIAEVTRLEDRPKLLGLFGGVFAVSSVIGPLLGGAFTDKVSWRWCFYINLPIGGITIGAILLILGPQPPPPIQEHVAKFVEGKFRRWTLGRWCPPRSSIAFRLFAIDYTGTAVMLACIASLVLALQWGGEKYAWRSGTIIGVFVCFAGLVVLLVLFEWRLAGPTSILPLGLFKDRTQVGASLSAFFLMFTLLIGTYYLPIYYQSTRGVSATKSGIDILPFMLGVVFAAGISGGLVSYNGRYWYFLVAAPAFICIGSGLLYTITVDSTSARVAGYQILLAIGVGCVMQNTIIAVQADCPDERDVAQKTALVTFAQLVGGTIGIAIASSIFGNRLASALHEFAPDAPFDLVRNSVDAIKTIAPDLQPGVRHAYVLALNRVFIIGVAAGGLASIVALPIRNLSVKGKDLMAAAA